MSAGNAGDQGKNLMPFSDLTPQHHAVHHSRIMQQPDKFQYKKTMTILPQSQSVGSTGSAQYQQPNYSVSPQRNSSKGSARSRQSSISNDLTKRGGQKVQTNAAQQIPMNPTQIGKQIGNLVETTLRSQLSSFLDNLKASRDEQQVESIDYSPEFESMYQSDHFIHMQEKMVNYFAQKYEDQVQQSKELIEGMQSLLQDLKSIREDTSTTEFNEEKAFKNNKKKKASGAGSDTEMNDEVFEEDDDCEPKIDITDLIKGYKFRCEIERAFFFHVFYDIIHQQFNLHLEPNEKHLFESKSSKVDITQIFKTHDIKAVIDGR